MQFYKNITITGFNFFEKINKNDNIHYYQDNCISNHNSIKEKGIINQLTEIKILK